jgi:micrococcal nuclease
MRACRNAGIALAAMLAALTAARAEEPVHCELEPGPTRAVIAVIDGETLKLDDGAELRLIGALSPRAPDNGGEASFWEPEVAAKAALEKLVLGRSIELAYLGRRTDRYGRLLAHAFVAPPLQPPADTLPSALVPEAATPAEEPERIWVQAHLLGLGHARAYTLPSSTGCVAQMLAHEALARSNRAGLWSHAAYQIRDANKPRDLARWRSTFQIVEGTVVRVVDTKGATLLTFGNDGTGDFVVVLKSAERRGMTGALAAVNELAGKRVRVRGWIERRTGPAIEIHHPAQIEVVGDGPMTSTMAASGTALTRYRRPPSRRPAVTP